MGRANYNQTIKSSGWQNISNKNKQQDIKGK